jgi:hypothetical protein
MASPFKWEGCSNLESRSYTCGHCGNQLASEKGYVGYLPGVSKLAQFIYLCHYCQKPTFFDFIGGQTPGAFYGNSVKDIPKDVEALYDESRSCTSCNAYTASVLCSRKLLMNIAVSKGAAEGLKFIEYIEFMANKNFIPPHGKDWVDHIRKKGNEATHEITIMKKEEAEELIDFIEMLLKFIYEFPATIKRRSTN